MAHADFRKSMQALVEEVKARGEPEAEDQSIAGLLLKLKNPKTGVGRCLLHMSPSHLTSSTLSQRCSHFPSSIACLCRGTASG